MITEEQRQILTEWLGECWHEISCIDGERMCSCGVVGNLNITLAHKGNRTFDNWNDFGAVVEKITREQGEIVFEKMPTNIPAKEIPERFCTLVAEAIKEGVIK